MPARSALPVLSPWRAFVERWQNCQECNLCETRKNIVLARGSVPCDVLFVGEAPGESEDVLGLPFSGPAGRLLDRIVERAIGGKVWFVVERDGKPNQDVPITWAMTNLVCCIPRDEAGAKAGEPDANDVLACQPRLAEFIELCRPRLIVAVGALATKWLGNQRARYGIDVPVVSITHPAAILRSNVAQQGIAVQQCVVRIANAVEELES